MSRGFWPAVAALRCQLISAKHRRTLVAPGPQGLGVVLGGGAPGAGSGQFGGVEPAAVDAAVERGNRWYAQRLEPVDGPLEAVAARFFAVLLRGMAFDQGADVVARTEALAGAGQHQHAYRRIPVDPVEGLA